MYSRYLHTQLIIKDSKNLLNSKLCRYWLPEKFYNLMPRKKSYMLVNLRIDFNGELVFIDGTIWKMHRLYVNNTYNFPII